MTRPGAEALCYDHDRFRIGGVVLLPLYERTHILRCDKLHLMAEPTQLTRPVMRTGSGLHHNDSRGMISHEAEELWP